MILLGSEVGSNSAFWMFIGWPKYQSMLGNDCVARVGFYFTGQKGISRVTFERVAHWLSLASFFYISNAAVNKQNMSSAPWGWQSKERKTLKVVTSWLHWLCTQCEEGSNSICLLYFKTVSVWWQMQKQNWVYEFKIVIFFFLRDCNSCYLTSLST